MLMPTIAYSSFGRVLEPFKRRLAISSSSITVTVTIATSDESSGQGVANAINSEDVYSLSSALGQEVEEAAKGRIPSYLVLRFDLSRRI